MVLFVGAIVTPLTAPVAAITISPTPFLVSSLLSVA
jgi:hypothetical protein